MTLKSVFNSILFLAASATAAASVPIDLSVTAMGSAGSGNFAPYYVASNNNGLITQRDNALLDVSLCSRDTLSCGLSYRWGVEALGGYSSTVDYKRFSPRDGWSVNPQHPSAARLQQLYGRVDWHSLFMTVGMVNPSSALLDNRLSSGDLIESANSRPIPQVRVGFNDFQPIPFTQGWVEIQGEISYGKMTDNGWLRSHYNYYNDHINLGQFHTYKRCYLRTMSSQPFSLTVGMQVGAFYGGTTSTYNKGKLISTERHAAGIKEMFKMIIPTGGDESYYLGSILGCWDIQGRLRLPGRATLKAYLQKPYETGSGIGFLNGFDGLWGLEYKTNSRALVNGLVVEYLDFTNQSGPIHFDPTDIPGCTFPYHTDGGDDYYNNYTYNAYANYGLSIGTPFLPSPLYNLDGYLAYVDNMIRGFHVGFSGDITPRLSYRLLGSWRQGWGTSRLPRAESVYNRSAMVEATYTMPLHGGRLDLSGAIALDHGTIYGNNLGTLLSLRYSMNLLR